MEEEQPASRSRRWPRFAADLAVTLLGLVLISFALYEPSLPQPSSPDSYRAAARVSARGDMANGRAWVDLEKGLPVGFPMEAITAETPEATPSPEATLLAQDLSPAALGIGGPVETALPLSTRAISVTVPVTPTLEPPRTEVIVYKVKAGDNVWLISQRYGITMDTVVWANGSLELDPDLLSIGQELYILPVSGVWHTVKEGETLAAIAKRYQVDVKKIVDYAPNRLSPGSEPTVGQKLIIPDGIKPFEPHVVYTEGGAVTVNARPEPGRFIWPCNGVITQPFNSRYHLAIDIGNAEGTPLYAADAGTVTLAEAAGTLGNAVRIDHGNGYVTLYGHLSVIQVQVGQYVQRGQQIGLMGSTGKSTGPHVHFMVTYYGGAVNPVRYLPH